MKIGRTFHYFSCNDSALNSIIWLEQTLDSYGKTTDGLGLYQRFRRFSPIGLQMNLIALKFGFQKITEIPVFDLVEKKTYEPLPDLEIFVDVE